MKSKRTWIIAASAVLVAVVAGVVLYVALHKNKNNPTGSTTPTPTEEAGEHLKTGPFTVNFELPPTVSELDRRNTEMPQTTSVPKGTKISELAVPTRYSSMFLAWTYDAAGTKRANKEDEITDDITLYPQFSPTAGSDGVKGYNYVAKTKVPGTYAIELVSYGLTKDEVLKAITVINSGRAGAAVPFNLRSLREEEEITWLKSAGLNWKTAQAVWACVEKSENAGEGEEVSLKDMIYGLTKNTGDPMIKLSEDEANMVWNHLSLENFVSEDEKQFLDLSDETLEMLKTLDIDFATVTEEELLTRYGLGADDSLERVWREEFKLTVDQVRILEDILYSEKEIRGDHWIITSYDSEWEGGFLYSVGISDTSKLRFVYDGVVTGNEVVEYNFTIELVEVSDIQVDDRVIHVSADDVTGVEFRGVLNLENDDEGNLQATENTGSGIMTYKGSEKFGVGSVVAVHKGTYDANGLTNSDVAYVKITSVKAGGSYGYEYAGLDEILASDNIIPVPDDGSISDGTITVANSNLNFDNKAYQEYGLDGTTKIKVGDYLAFFTGKLGGSDFKLTGHGRIGKITENSESKTTTFAYTVVSEEELTESEVALAATLPEVEIQMSDVDAKKLEEDMRKQIADSGIVDETRDLFMTIIAGDDIDFDSLEHGEELKNMKFKTDGEDLTLEQIRYLADGASKVEVSDINFALTLDYKLSHFAGKKGLRGEAAVTFTIKIKLGDAGFLVIQPAIVLEQEIMLTPSVQVKRHKNKLGLTSSLDITAALDAGTYTGFGVTVTAKTEAAPNKNMGKDFAEMVGGFIDNGDMSSLEARQKAAKALIKGGDFLEKQSKKQKEKGQGYGVTVPMTGDGDTEKGKQEFNSPGIGGDLPTKYSNMLSNDSQYIKLVDVDLGSFDIPIDPTGIIHVGMKINFSVQLKINAMIGAGVSYENAKRYSYAFRAKIWGGGPEYDANAVGSAPSGSDVKDLANSFRADFYAFGMVGLKAGVSLDLRVGIFSTDLDSVGVVAQAGVYAELYGFLYVYYEKKGGEPAKHGASGSLYFEMGIYTDISVKVQIGGGMASKSWSLYSTKTPLLKLGCEQFPLDFVIKQSDPKLSVEIPNGQNTVKIDDSIFNMKLMVLKSGKVVEKNMDSKHVCTEGAVKYTATILNVVDTEETNGLVVSTERSWTQNHEDNFTVECYDLTGKNGTVVPGASSFQYLPGTNEIYVCPIDGTKDEVYGKVVFKFKNHAFGFNTEVFERTVYVHWKGTMRSARVEYFLQKNYNDGEDTRDFELAGNGSVSGYDGICCYVDITPDFCNNTFPGYTLLYLKYPDEEQLNDLYNEAIEELETAKLRDHNAFNNYMMDMSEANDKKRQETAQQLKLAQAKHSYYYNLFWKYHDDNEAAVANQSGRTYFTMRGSDTVIRVYFKKQDIVSLWIAVDPETNEVVYNDGVSRTSFESNAQKGYFLNLRYDWLLQNQKVMNFVPESLANYRPDDYTVEWYIYPCPMGEISYKQERQVNLCYAAYDAVQMVREKDLSKLTKVTEDTLVNNINNVIIGVLTGKEVPIHWMDGDTEIATTTGRFADRVAFETTAPQKSGCVFTQWETKDGTPITADTMVTGELYAYARYLGEERTVNWITEDGATAQTRVRVNDGIYQSVPEELSVEGCTWIWRTSKDDLKTELLPGALWPNEDNITLYGRKSIGFSSITWIYDDKEHRTFCEIGTVPVRPELPANGDLDLVWKFEDGTVMQSNFIMPRGSVTVTASQHKHEWSNETGTVPATCRSAGHQGLVCTVCGLIADGTEIPIDPKAHAWEEYVVIPATCKDKGVMGRHCSYCDAVDETYKKPIDIDPNNHTGNTEIRNAKEPCCVEGYSGDTYCVDCDSIVMAGYALEPTYNKHGTVHLEGYVEATCQSWGYSGDYFCDDCGFRVCYGHTLPLSAHVGEEDKSKEVKATCTTPGKIVWKCIHCDYTWEVDLGINDAAHTWDEGTEISKQTCTTDGVIRYTCKECGATEEVVEKATGEHDWQIESKTDATCEKDGLVVYKCSMCGDTKEEILESSGAHEWTKWELIQQPTCTKPGIRRYTCKLCGETKDEETEIDPNAHGKLSDPEIVTEPGCETRGQQRRQCPDCKEYFYEDLPPVGHEWGEPTYSWSSDCSSVTATVTCMRDKTHTVTETVKTTAKVTKKATLDAMGETTYTAEFKNSAFKTQTKTLENVEKLSPDWKEPTYSWSKDYSSVTAKRVSRVDSSVVEEETVATTSNKTKDASCDSDGEIVYTAVFKNTAFGTQTKKVTIDKLGHDWVLKSTDKPGPVYGKDSYGDEICKDWKAGNKHYECSHCGAGKDEKIKVSVGIQNGLGEDHAKLDGTTKITFDLGSLINPEYTGDLTFNGYFTSMENLQTFGDLVECWVIPTPYTEDNKGWYYYWVDFTEAEEERNMKLMQYGEMDGTFKYADKDKSYKNMKVVDFTGTSLTINVTFTPKFTDTFETVTFTVTFKLPAPDKRS